NAAPLAERLVERLPQHDGDILDGMVGVNVKVTLCLDDQVEQPVHGDMVQHVVEKAHAGADLSLARAVEVEGKRDVRLVGLARDGRAAVGHVYCPLSFQLHPFVGAGRDARCSASTASMDLPPPSTPLAMRAPPL